MAIKWILKIIIPAMNYLIFKIHLIITIDWNF